jgi:hypothetical protein
MPTPRPFTDAERRQAVESRLAGSAERKRRHVAACGVSVDSLLAGAPHPLPSYAQAHVAKARLGRTRSLIALKCLDCCNWQKAEVAACTITSCPLHCLRPYRQRESAPG